MIAVHRPTCSNSNIGVLKKCLKSRIIDFKKLTSFLKSALKTLPTRSTSHFIKKITRIDAGRKSQKSIKKSVILQILRSDFDKSLIRMIAVYKPTCWNWNIGVLKKCLKSRIIDFEKLTSLIKSVWKVLLTPSTSHFFKRIARIDAKSKSQKSIKNVSFSRSSDPISKNV